MARAIDGELLELEIANIANKLAKSDAQKALMGRVMYCVEHMPTLTPQNEPLFFYIFSFAISNNESCYPVYLTDFNRFNDCY